MRRILLLSGFLCFLMCEVAGAQTSAACKRRNVRAVKVVEPPDQYDILVHYPDQPAIFPGNLYEWLSRNLYYPNTSAENGREGYVYVQFIINVDGSVQDCRIARTSADSLLDAEALRVVRSMPPWLPARKEDRPVRSIFKVKVTFRLND